MKHEYHDREDGLLHCKVCGGAECSLTIDCSGRAITAQEADDICDLKLEYIHRRGWLAPLPSVLAQLAERDKTILEQQARIAVLTECCIVKAGLIIQTPESLEAALKAERIKTLETVVQLRVITDSIHDYFDKILDMVWRIKEQP